MSKKKGRAQRLSGDLLLGAVAIRTGILAGQLIKKKIGKSRPEGEVTPPKAERVIPVREDVRVELKKVDVFLPGRAQPQTEAVEEPVPVKRKRSVFGIIFKAIDILSGIALLAALGFMIYLVICTSRGEVADVFGKSVLKVITGSMEPTILTGDYIIIDRNGLDDLKVGDIISFYSEEEDIFGSLCTHRIMAISGDGLYSTQGDANPVEDRHDVRREQILGKYIRKARILRWAGSFADTRKLILIAVIIPLLLVSFYEVFSVSRLWKKVIAEHEKPKETRWEYEERIRREAIEEYLAKHRQGAA